MWLSTVIRLLQAESSALALDQDQNIQELIIDTRKIANASHALFFALRGPLRDGHQYIHHAYEKGIRFFVVENLPSSDSYAGAIFLKVPNTLKALQSIGKFQRAQFNYPVIGITGSNGKTIVKEWLYQLLSQIPPYNELAGPVRSPKSYNSQIGVPLSTWLMQEHNTIGIFEAGISQPGEMSALAKIIAPTIGIFTNVGDAHTDGFDSKLQKIQEKLRLFQSVRKLIYCRDNENLHQEIQKWQQEQAKHGPAPELYNWSVRDDASLIIKEIRQNGALSLIDATFQGQAVSISIPYTDKAYLENAIHCWVCLLMLGIDHELIRELMSKLVPVAMRLQLVEGINNCTIINDSYNSDFTALKIAIDFLQQQKQHPTKTLILSDILEVGQDSATYYTKVAQLIQQKGINRFIGIGPKMMMHQSLFAQHSGMSCTFFESTELFLQHFDPKTFREETILLKGARPFGFERIKTLLEQKTHKTVLEVDLSAIQHNLRAYKSMLAPGVKLMAMVKAFAYGTGSVEIANLLQFEGVDYLTVAYLDEGIALRRAGISLPIMVMSPEFGAFDQMIQWKIEPEIFSIESLKAFIQAAEQLDTENYPIHIKLDTGMHRLGFEQYMLDELIQTLKQTKAVKVQSIFSHLVGSDEADFDGFTEHQAQSYRSMSEYLMHGLGYKPIRHLCNSAAISRFPELQFDMVRLGIGLYGVDANPMMQQKLKHVATLKTTVAQVRKIAKDDTVGYSRRGKVQKDSKIATVSIGYADGYFRDFGNGNAFMLVNGQPARTLGSVCMDMCMLDVSDIEQVAPGDKVVVFGKDLSITELASWANTIPYEILTSVSQRVKRVYIDEE